MNAPAAETDGAAGSEVDGPSFDGPEVEVEVGVAGADGTAARPVVAVVGRPNVGKSTLVNRVLGRRAAVVADQPGVTRDRVTYDAQWAGRDFVVTDTGGWLPDATGLAAGVAAQAEAAVGTADVVLLVVDATVGAVEEDAAVISVLRRAAVPVVLAANKVDDPNRESDAAALWSLGVGEPYPVSALHGRGSGDLLDAVVAALPARRPPRAVEEGPRRVALLGRPNVGKSSLLNRMAGEQRVVVDDVAGTTRDAVDLDVELDGEVWRLVDTAGLRRKGHVAQGPDHYAVVRTDAALRAAEAVVVVVDASEPVAEQDLRVMGRVAEEGRALVLALNKWDLVDDERRERLEVELDRGLVRLPWVPYVRISALSGRGVHRLAPALRTALAAWDHRVPTGRLNALITELVAGHPPPVRGGKQTKILFATQASTRPPLVALFTSGPLEDSYLRFVERRLRETEPFEGTPIRVVVRRREKRGR